MPYEKARAAMKFGASRPTLYQVEIPKATNNANFDANDYLKFFCNSTAIPGVVTKGVGANAQERQGVIREVASAVQYTKPFSMDVIERSDFHVYDNLKRWFDLTCPGSNSDADENQRMSYYEDYTCDLILTKLEYDRDISNTKVFEKVTSGKTTNEGFNKVLTVTFKNAYIVKIGDIRLASNMSDNFTSYSVDFTYETYNTVIKKDGN